MFRLLFPKELVNTFGEYISNLGMKQLRIAETEKYAHVTFFLQWRCKRLFRRRPNSGEFLQKWQRTIYNPK